MAPEKQRPPKTKSTQPGTLKWEHEAIFRVLVFGSESGMGLQMALVVRTFLLVCFQVLEETMRQAENHVTGKCS